MAYDEELAHRIRALLGTRAGVTEKRMFGGLAFMLNGNMAVGASGKGGIMLRVPPDETDDLVARPHAGPMHMAGNKPARGWIRVAAVGLDSDEELAQWVAIGVEYAAGLPPK